MFQTKGVEKTKTQFYFVTLLFKNYAIYEIMWKNTVEPGKPQMTIWRKCTARWIPKATNICSGQVIFIAFPLQEWASMSCYMYTAGLVD
jgi:hypothetical protein